LPIISDNNGFDRTKETEQQQQQQTPALTGTCVMRCYEVMR